MAKVLMIIPPERFRDEELFVTKEELEKDKHSISILSSKKGNIKGSRGGNSDSIGTIEEVNTDNYDAVVFVGGGGSKLLFSNQDAIRIAQEMFSKNKVVAAICLAPVILANAGILNGKNATVAGTESESLEVMGAHYTGPGVTVDGKIITGNAPKASKLFGQKINEALRKAT